MSGFYGGPNNGSNNSSYNESSSSDDFSSNSSNFCYVLGTQEGTSESDIVFGILIGIMGLFAFIMTLFSQGTLAAKVFIEIIIFVIFGGVSIALIATGIDKGNKTKETIDKTIEANKTTLDNYYKYVDKNKKPKMTLETKELKPNRIKTLICRIFGLVLILLGILFMFLLNQAKVTATITRKNDFFDTVQYDFSYEYNGNTYYGNGKDDIAYSDKLNVNTEHDIYVKVINPSDYSFDVNYSNIILLIIFSTVGGILLIYGVVARRKYLVSIKFVGDLNKDGKIDEKDYEIYKLGEAIGIKLEVTEEEKM